MIHQECFIIVAIVVSQHWNLLLLLEAGRLQGGLSKPQTWGMSRILRSFLDPGYSDFL